jgi:hypothetical protein
MKALRAIPILFVLTLVLSCATFSAVIDTARMTPADLVALVETIYNARFLEHENRTEFLDKLTQQEREDLQDLKDSLVTVYPYIKSFNRALDVGLQPTAADRQALENFIRDYYYGRRQ